MNSKTFLFIVCLLFFSNAENEAIGIKPVFYHQNQVKKTEVVKAQTELKRWNSSRHICIWKICSFRRRT